MYYACPSPKTIGAILDFYQFFACLKYNLQKEKVKELGIYK